MRVRDLMTCSLVTATPEMPIVEARTLMAERHIRHLLIMHDGVLAGIVTDRDIRLNLPSPATSLSVWELNYLIGKLTVGQVMRTSVLAVGPERDARDAALIMMDHKIGALPVVDGGRLLGIVTETDFLRAFIAANVDEAYAGR